MRAPSPMPRSRRRTTAVRGRAAPPTMATGAGSACPFATRNAPSRPASGPPSAASGTGSYDTALAETAIGRSEAEVVRRRGPWRTMGAVEFAALDRVDWYDNRRLLAPIGNIPPAEAGERYHAQPSRVLRPMAGTGRRALTGLGPLSITAPPKLEPAGPVS